MTASPPETETTADPLEEFVDRISNALPGTTEVLNGTVKVTVDASEWVEALTTARDAFGMVFFSFLSAIDWANQVAVGDPLQDEVDEHFEVIATVGDLSTGSRITFSTSIDKTDPALDTLTGVYTGANWHEREAAEMFGIEFRGHPDPGNLYLPDGFIGHPLLKSYGLASREVKPWPGKVDVEGMPETDADPEAPSTENPEA